MYSAAWSSATVVVYRGSTCTSWACSAGAAAVRHSARARVRVMGWYMAGWVLAVDVGVEFGLFFVDGLVRMAQI